MDRNYGSNEEALNVAKQAVWLAWNACGGTSGYGFMQDRGPNQTPETVWDHAYNERDYHGRRNEEPASINCDYVMGRMMKLYFTVKDKILTHRDGEGRRDYQAWCGKYPTYASLFDAAETEVLKKAA